MEKVIWAIIFLVTPALILYACYKVKFLGKIGPIILSYALGLILGNFGLIPQSVRPVQNFIVEVSIPIALPLLLFSLDVRKFFSIAGRTFLSLVLALIALLIALYIGYLLFGHKIPEGWKVFGLLVGVYTGGTPNLASISTALNVDPNTYIVVHSSDTFFGIFFLLYLLTLAQKHLLKILPPFHFGKAIERENRLGQEAQRTALKFDDSPAAYKDLLKKENIRDLVIAFAITLIVVGLSVAIGKLASKNVFEAVVILSITSFAIGLSFIKRVRNLRKTFQAGMYFILIFSFAVATLGKFDKIISSSPYIFYYVVWTVTMSFVFHVLLSKIFKVDADTTIIVTTALTMSPPFVPVVAQALKNRYVIISGLIIGIIGYAIGNYLGVFLAYYIKGF